jgi:mannosyl-oligosaccharide alpha-1,2-mannosidase
MLGRNRRVRLLAAAICVAVVFFLYERNTAEQYLAPAGIVGGGAVLRPDHHSLSTDHHPEGPAPPVAKPQLEPEPESPRPAPPSSSKSIPVDDGDDTSAIAPVPATTAPIPTLPPPAAASLVDDDDDLPSGIDLIDLPGESRPYPDHLSHSTDSRPKQHWTKQPEKFPVTSTIPLPSGSPSPIPLIQNAQKGADVRRLAAIKEAAEHAWAGYRSRGWGFDEVRPVSGHSKNTFNGWGATLVDSLDTLWIMGMKHEFEEAVNQTALIDFTTSSKSDIPLFEVTIRYLGGLIAAYDVSGQQYRVLLDKAVELAEILYSAFDTPNRMPDTYYHWKPAFSANTHRASTRVVLAELGTLSLEFTRLAQLAKEPKYYDAIARITDALEEWQNQTRLPGMWPTSVDASGCAKPVRIAETYRSQQVPVAGRNSRVGSVSPSDGVVTHNEPHVDMSRRVSGEILDERDEDVPVEIMKRQLPAGDAQPAPVVVGADGGANVATGFQYKQSVTTQPTPTFHQGSTSDYYSDDEDEEPECIPQGLRSPSKSGAESFTLGGQSDSLYEYLPKEYVLLGGRVDQYRTMYLDSMKPVIEKLIFRPMTPDNLDILISGEVISQVNYTTDEMYETHKPKNEHLTCFVGGMLAMGGKIFELPEHVELGRKLTDGCIWSYNVTTTGIMPESYTAAACMDTGNCEWNETLWHEQLDPYRASREEQRKMWILQYGEEALENYVNPTLEPSYNSHISGSKSPGSSDVGPVDRIPERLLNAQNDKAAHHDGQTRSDTRGSQLGKTKRQLEDESTPRAVQDHAPAVSDPLELAAADVTPSKTTSMAASSASEYDYDDSYISAAPIYTPPPPVTHEEFVKKKIEDERLPRGMTKLESRKYILRPEAIESVFYMYRITGEQYWRDRGWDMFMAVEKHTRAEYGHSAIDDVTKAHPEQDDGMESFWLAETLKYYYLLFDDPDKWSLDDWVLNTEAHFFQRPENPVSGG